MSTRKNERKKEEGKKPGQSELKSGLCQITVVKEVRNKLLRV